MKVKYFKKQIDAAMEEIIGGVSHAMLVAMDGKDSTDAIRREIVEAIAHELRRVPEAVVLHLESDDESDECVDIDILSERFHAVLYEDLQFASVPLQDGGEQE